MAVLPLVYLTLLLNLLPCVKKQILKPKNILEKLRLPSSIIMILYLLPQVVPAWNSPTNHIKPDLRLNILTNGMPLAHKLSENNNVTVECPAGIYNYFHEGIYGKEVKELISKRYAQYCFTSCNGIDLINGLTFSTDLDMTLIRACRDNCDQLIVLADHTKFGMTYYFKTLSIKEIDVIITDQEPAEKWITYCEENGITLIY